MNNLRTPDYSLHKIPEQEKDQIKQGEKQQEVKTEEKIETTEPKLKRQVRDAQILNLSLQRPLGGQLSQSAGKS